LTMGKALKIVITVDPEIPVPPRHYGGIERIVHMLIEGLVEKGHEVHLFAHPESKVPARLIPYQGTRSASRRDTLRNALAIQRYVKQEGADIVHSFSRLAYLFLLMRDSVVKIQSYQRHITPRSVHMGMFLGGATLTFTACSRFCAGTAGPAGRTWTIIPNGVPIRKYRYVPHTEPDAPLVFLGRVERIKGPHSAIEVAQKTGKKLLIAGNRAESGHDYEYFKNEIEPHCDGKQIRYVGPVGDEEKNGLLGRARAVLFPIEWKEPCGIVMAEAFACGTPIIAFGRGSVPEIVQNGVNGFVCSTTQEMVDAVRRIDSVKRDTCRRIAEERFSDTVIVKAYEELYFSLVRKREISRA
jgi:glycosyltransferase involved in cell wall biosynthesis